MACRTMQLRFLKLGTVLTYAFKWPLESYSFQLPHLVPSVSTCRLRVHYSLEVVWYGAQPRRVLHSVHVLAQLSQQAEEELGSIVLSSNRKQGNTNMKYKGSFIQVSFKDIMEAGFDFFFLLWCLCCIMMFRWINKQPGIQQIWNWWLHITINRQMYGLFEHRSLWGEMSMVNAVILLFSLL